MNIKVGRPSEPDQNFDSSKIGGKALSDTSQKQTEKALNKTTDLRTISAICNKAIAEDKSQIEPNVHHAKTVSKMGEQISINKESTLALGIIEWVRNFARFSKENELQKELQKEENLGRNRGKELQKEAVRSVQGHLEQDPSDFGEIHDILSKVLSIIMESNTVLIEDPYDIELMKEKILSHLNELAPNAAEKTLHHHNFTHLTRDSPPDVAL